MNVIIFGSPGAGKGTQAQNIAKKFNLHQMSTGDLLRSEIKKETEIGKEIENIISEGEFVSDDIVNKLLDKIIKNPDYKNRIIFDGYPRNISQAKNLKTLLNKDSQSIGAVLYLYVSKNIIEKRIIAFFTSNSSNNSFFYNIFTNIQIEYSGNRLTVFTE